MSTWTHEKDALLMAMADYITGDNVAGPLKRIIAAKKAVLATPPKASAREAERDAEIEQLKADITRFAMASERYRDQLIVAEQNLSLAKCDSKREIDALRNHDIEAAAKRAEAAFHAGGSFRWDFRRERVERWRAVARAVLTGKSEGG